MHNCPYSGILCKDCQYPAMKQNGDRSTEEYLRIHEQLKQHQGNTLFEVRQTAVVLFDKEMEEKATILNELISLDKEEEAKELYFKWIGTVQEYYYCNHPLCKRLVARVSHNSNTHTMYIEKEKRLGITSLHWINNNPKIIPYDDFDFKTEAFFSNVLWKHLQNQHYHKCICGSTTFNNGTVCAKCNMNSSNSTDVDNAMEINNILQLQSNRYDKGVETAIISSTTNQHVTPNLDPVWLVPSKYNNESITHIHVIHTTLC
jgi:hypothetical protein